MIHNNNNISIWYSSASTRWVEKFGLPKELPKELQELEDKFKNKQNRVRI